MIVVYAVTLNLPEEALPGADQAFDQLATALDPERAIVVRSVSTTARPDYRGAGLLHGGEPRA